VNPLSHHVCDDVAGDVVGQPAAVNVFGSNVIFATMPCRRERARGAPNAVGRSEPRESQYSSSIAAPWLPISIGQPILLESIP
jgi:hypothetical protein